jgi:hypothetical protein
LLQAKLLGVVAINPDVTDKSLNADHLLLSVERKWEKTDELNNYLFTCRKPE